ncbi:OB-fold domain-containing protein, partial [Nocardia cyriacigeorgica]|uniref:OB-fold domain-containing protein n=1 Tax=Nocardia cyriacigeorgica TaxID=135487 RepID=UPI003CC80705
MATAGFLSPGGAADFGWTGYTPLSNELHSPGVGYRLNATPATLSGLTRGEQTRQYTAMIVREDTMTLNRIA